MRTSRGLLALLALVLGLTACPRRPPSATDVLEDAAARAQKGSGEARTLALAGFHTWLVQGDAAAAQARFDAAIAKEPGEPYALMGQHLLARRMAAPDRALTAALELAVRAPSHPLSVPAARYILDQVGTSPEVDERILQGTRKALEAGATGEAAHLLRGCQMAIHIVRGDLEARAAAVKEVGSATVATLVGPFSPYHVLAFDEPTPPEQDGSLVGPFTGPYGPLAPRTLVAPDGRHRLDGEPAESDVYLLAFDAEVPADGLYLARTVSSSSFKVLMDGALLLERRAFARPEPTVTGRALRLSAGKHRFVVKLTKENALGTLSFSLPRADGRPSDVRFTAATGPAPSWNASEPAAVDSPLFYPGAAQLAAALEEEAGGLLATYLAARDGVGRDHDGTRRLLAQVDEAITTPALLLLRAEVAAQDRTVPTKVARGRATRDLEATLAKDPRDVSALLMRAELSLNDGQPAAAQEALKSAQELAGPSSHPVHLLRARAAIALQVDAQAEEALDAALRAQPRLCEALALRYTLARRRDAVALTDQLITELNGCYGSRTRAAEHARQRGDMAAAAKLYAEVLERDPGDVSTGATLANLYVSLRRYEEAEATLRELMRLWPRAAFLYKRLADVKEYAGAQAEALALREQALSLDGSDLSLRRAVERAKTGKELLQDYAIDGKAALAAYQASRGEEGSSAAYVLDAAAVQVFPNGTVVNRIHTIQKALEQGGIEDIAEVNLPTGAQVLALRTIKADGTVLEPENIEGKDNISLPGVNVGDYVEVEYLLSEPGRGPAQPGFHASAFYFQVANMPNNQATYTVVAPKGTGLRVDAHNMKAPPPVTRGDVEIFTHEARRVPPFLPEPESPWSTNEFLPFVIVGAGTTGHERLVSVYADTYLDRTRAGTEVEAFARKAAGELTGLEAVKALHTAVMKRLPGRELGMSHSASATLAQDRGSRLMLLKASLEVLGIPARLAVVHSFTVDQTPYLFPNESLLTYSCLRVEVPGEEPVWLDTSVRFGPFGELPEAARGERDAYLLPEPGRPLMMVKTPPLVEKSEKQVQLWLEVTPDGKLQGRGEEVYSGFKGAQLAESFEVLSAESRKQALQGAVTRYFGGAELTSVKLEHAEEVGAPFILRYEFNVPRFARVEGNQRMVMGPVTFPSMLGRQYVQLSSRDTPLFLDESVASNTQVIVTLPEGLRLQDAQAALKVNSRFGRYVRSEKQEGRVLTIIEGLRLPRARIAPKDYDAFAQWAGDVDLIQTRDLVLAP
jgi:tetratricopeptide (TPR) repeat protein